MPTALRANFVFLLGSCIFFGHNGAADADEFRQEREKWVFTTMGDLTAPSMSPDGGTLYVASDVPEMSVYALDVKDGRKLWAFNASHGLDFLGPCCNSHKDGISRPIVSPDGAALYFRAGLGFFGVRTNNGSLKFAWNLFDAMAGDPTISADSQTLYIASHSDKLICALNLTVNRSVYWDWRECTWVKSAWSSTSVVVSHDGKSMYYGSEGGNVTALASADGRTEWGYYVYTQSVGQPVPALDGGMIYVAETDGTSYYALNAVDGSKMWQYEYLLTASAPALSPESDTVYAGFQGGGMKVRAKDGTYQLANSTLVALDAQSGQQKWAFNTSVDWRFTGTPVVAGGIAYFGIYWEGWSDRKGVFYAVNVTDGGQVFAVSMLLYTTAAAQPVAAVTPDGSMVFVVSKESRDGSTCNLHALMATPTEAITHIVV